MEVYTRLSIPLLNWYHIILSYLLCFYTYTAILVAILVVIATPVGIALPVIPSLDTTYVLGIEWVGGCDESLWSEV